MAISFDGVVLSWNKGLIGKRLLSAINDGTATIAFKNISAAGRTLVNSARGLICSEPKRRTNEAESSGNWRAAPWLHEILRCSPISFEKYHS